MLWQTSVSLFVSERTIVETCNLHHGRHTIGIYCIGSVHTVRNKSGWVFTLHNVLQETSYPRSPHYTLLFHLVANKPHYNTWVVTEVMHYIHNIFLCPFVEIFVVAIAHFGNAPLVKCFYSNHHTHFISSFNQFRSRHIMSSTYSIHTHVLQNANLTTNGCIINSSAQWAKVVMHTNTFKFNHATI